VACCPQALKQHNNDNKADGIFTDKQVSTHCLTNKGMQLNNNLQNIFKEDNKTHKAQIRDYGQVPSN
jgi:hypothetical protein